MRFLPKSAYLATPQHASAYVSTATRLLSKAQSLYRASPQHRTSSSSDTSASAKAGNPLEQLWPLAEGTFASQLLAQLPKEDLLGLCLLYWRLLAALPDLAPACSSTPQAEEARFVNALVNITCLSKSLPAPRTRIELYAKMVLARHMERPCELSGCAHHKVQCLAYVA